MAESIASEVTAPTMPSYMIPHFKRAIKIAERQTGNLLAHNYHFYVSEDMYLEITGSDGFGRNAFTIYGIRIRMSTTREGAECLLAGSDCKDVKFLVPPNTSPIVSPLLAIVDWFNRLVGVGNPKSKRSGGQMCALSEIFEETGE